MSEEKNRNQADLNGKQRRYLRSLAHHLTPVVIVGREGLSGPVIAGIDDVLAARELIKIKLGPNCPLAKKEAAEIAARQTGACLVQLIGKTIILFRENEKLKPGKRVHLP